MNDTRNRSNPPAFFLILFAICLEMVNLETNQNISILYSLFIIRLLVMHFRIVGVSLLLFISAIAALEFVCYCILVEIVEYLNWQMCG